MGGRWGADEDAYLEFFAQMRRPFEQVEWEFVFDMLRDHLNQEGKLDPSFITQASADLGPVKWHTLQELPSRGGQRKQIINSLGEKAQSLVLEMARRHTPLSRYTFRNTRTLLREYERRGIMKASVPRRKPKIERVLMRVEEQALYDRIDEYISHFYHKYENEKRGLGFVMTVYRRRLTSSFYAIRCSLERRLKYLRGQIGEEEIFTEDDTEQEELDFDQETTSGLEQDYFKAEFDYVNDFLQDLRLISAADSKLERLKAELDQIFRQRETILVFTLFTDTMDYLRDQLREVYGNQVACYSGRGGEIWNGIAWVETSKELVKNDFRDGNVRILLCTDSASEGLNLQSCGALINYDMPWNPMRVEQRIGRIDRIGQQYPEVWISNYFYRDTIEDQIYQRLADRIAWFEVVVGDLQPILAEVGEVTRRLAMLSPSERQTRLEEEIYKLKERVQARDFESLNLDEFVSKDMNTPGPTAPVTIEQLEYILTTSQTTAGLFTPHPMVDKAYLLEWENTTYPITFSPEVFDEHPVTFRLLTLGTPLLNQIFNAIPDLADNEPIAPFIRYSYEGDIKLRQWFLKNENATLELSTVLSLQDNIEKLNPGKEVEDEITGKLFDDHVKRLSGRQKSVIDFRRTAEYLTVRKRAQAVLLKTAMVEIALGMQPDLFDTEAYPTTFAEQSIRGLQRHGFPWSALLQLAYDAGLSPNEDHPYFQKISGDKKASLKGRFTQLEQEARNLTRILGHLNSTK